MSFFAFLSVWGDALRVILPGKKGGVSEGYCRAIVPPASLAWLKGAGLETDQLPYQHVGSLQGLPSDNLGGEKGPTKRADLEHSGH